MCLIFLSPVPFSAASVCLMLPHQKDHLYLLQFHTVYRWSMTVNHWVAGSSPAGGANVDGSSIGRAPDCGSGGCEFDSHPSTQ